MCFLVIKKSYNLNLTSANKAQKLLFNKNIFVNSHLLLFNILIILFSQSPKILNYSFMFSNFYFCNAFISVFCDFVSMKNE